jgi:phospholipase/lecithinase/hemolysin
MAVSITGRLLLQLLLLFLASHVGDLTEAAQIIQLIDDANQSHHVVGTGHNFSTTAGSQPHVESDAHSNLSINSSSATAPNSRSLLTTNSFTCPQAFFIFGDSLSDTGNVQFVFSGYNQSILNYPYGESYNFTEPGRDRFCDGRLLIDFLAQAFGFPFFEPIALQLHPTLTPDYTHGVNFAYAGATSRPDITLVPFFLQLQLDQFFVYKTAILNSAQPYTPVSFLPTAAYIIPEIGANDFYNSYNRGLSPQDVIDMILPQSLSSLISAVEQLHDSGARTIIVGNHSPQGCSPIMLTKFGGSGPFDSNGCLDEYNNVTRVFNARLQQALTNLQQSYAADGTLIIQYDGFSAITELFTDPARYGFDPNKKLKACCGFGGVYNCNPDVFCGGSGELSLPGVGPQFVRVDSAPDPQDYIVWDGIHLTQATHRLITSSFLTGQYVISPPGFNLKELCNLDFSQF